jgi:hypothetical protein
MAESASAADRDRIIGIAGVTASAGASASPGDIAEVSPVAELEARRRHFASRLMPVTPSSW